MAQRRKLEAALLGWTLGDERLTLPRLADLDKTASNIQAAPFGGSFNPFYQKHTLAGEIITDAEGR